MILLDTDVGCGCLGIVRSCLRVPRHNFPLDCSQPNLAQRMVQVAKLEFPVRGYLTYARSMYGNIERKSPTNMDLYRTIPPV